MRTSCRYAHVCSKCWRYNHGSETCTLTSSSRPAGARRAADLAESVRARHSQSNAQGEDAIPPNPRSRRNRPATWWWLTERFFASHAWIPRFVTHKCFYKSFVCKVCFVFSFVFNPLLACFKVCRSSLSCFDLPLNVKHSRNSSSNPILRTIFWKALAAGLQVSLNISLPLLGGMLIITHLF